MSRNLLVFYSNYKKESFIYNINIIGRSDFLALVLNADNFLLF